MTEAVEEVTVVQEMAGGTSVVPEEVEREDHIAWRVMAFVAFTLAVAAIFWHSLVDLARLSMRDETYSHMPLIPLVTIYLLYSERKRIFSDVRSAFLSGALVAAVGAGLCFVGFSYDQPVVYKDQLSLITLGALILCFGGFIAAFGMPSFRSARFPLLFLLFLVPIPSFLLIEIVRVLQEASTEVASVLFTLTGLPVLRDGFRFEVPGLSVVVAEQCCGIRSSISLFITGVLAAYLGLKSPWRRGLLILAVLPITIFKNALRIITLTLLGAYVDPRILSSTLHRMGGIPFFGLALILFGGVWWLLRWSEVTRKGVAGS